MQVDGVFLLDKPQGPTSNSILQRFKRKFDIAKAGHTGSLDPLATGMLPLCTGEATKFGQYLLDANKCYRVQGCIGSVTDTLDSEGVVLGRHDSQHIQSSQLSDVCQQFVGGYAQTPPMYSALKHDGQPLYRLARRGQIVERPTRRVHISKLSILSVDLPYFSLEVTCSKGTYIRSLIDDIGRKLAVGAHLTALRRLYVAPFAGEAMWHMDEIGDQQTLVETLKPIDCMLGHLPALSLTAEQATKLNHGRVIETDVDNSPGIIVRAYDEDRSFLGLVMSLGEGRLRAKRLVSHG